MADDSENNEFRELAADFADTLVCVGLVDSVSSNWPTEVQERWRERLVLMREWAQQQTQEAQEFASSYD